VQEVTIAEAAKCLGMSIDSIRRRIAKNELKARKVPSPHGEIYLVELPDDAVPAHDDAATGEKEDSTVAIEAMRKTISILETELEARRREVQELHVLLQQAQKQLPPGKAEDAKEEIKEDSKKEIPAKVSWWRRVFSRKKY
jgi:hypothetical protein